DNWSLESNGSSAGLIPDSGTRVVFDQSTSSATKASLSADAAAFSLNFFGNAPVEIDLGSHTLLIRSGLRINNQITSIRNGKMEFNSESGSSNIIDLGATVMEKVEMDVQFGQWRLVSAGVMDKVRIVDATVELDVLDFQVNELRLEPASTISGRVRNISFREGIFIGQGASLNVAPAFRFIGSEGRFSDLTRTDGLSLIVEGDQLQLQNAGQLKDLVLQKGELLLKQASTLVQTLDMKQGVVLNLMDNNQIRVIETITHESSTGNPSLIKAGSKGIFRHDPYKKYCFENLSVENVDLSGDAVVNLGAGAEISNSANWLKVNCSQVLFANFQVNYGCEGALVEFVNTTEGPATRYEWDFGSLGNSTDTSPSLVFPREGTYRISLTAIRGDYSMTYEKDVVIQANPLKKPSIVTNGTTLTSLIPAPMYQWYKNGQKIQGDVERSYQAEDEGAYQVALVTASCNRISEAVVISGMPDQLPLANYGYFIGPNPVSDRLRVAISNEYTGEVVLEIYGMNGALLEKAAFEKHHRELEWDMRLDFRAGIYVLLIKTGDMVLPYRLIKQ